MFRVEIIADHSEQWCGNALRFDTAEEAERYARDLMGRWSAVREWRVVACAEPSATTKVLDEVARRAGTNGG